MSPRCTFTAFFLVFSLLGACSDDDSSNSLDLGPNDDAAAMACREASTTASSTTAAYLASSDAAANPIGAAPAPYAIALPEGATGFIGLNLPEEHGDWAVFTSPRVEIVGQTDTEGNYSASSWLPMNNAACDGAGITDYRFHGHETGVQTIEFSAEGPRTLWLMFMQVGSGHMHHHGDGDMHMHHEDGGMHMHHEDGGMHSDGGA